MKDDAYYVKRCEILSEQAAAKGEAPVGSLIIKGGKIISEAIEASKNKNDVTCHAELEAIRLAVKKLKTNDLSDCVIYSTHEPCVMCSYAIRFYKIRKVVFQHTANYFGGISSSMPLLLIKEVPLHWGGIPEVVHFPQRGKVIAVFQELSNTTMEKKFNVGDHVTWNSEAGHMSGTIVKVHEKDFDYKGYTHHASKEQPQYEIKSDKTDHIAVHKTGVLSKKS